MRTIAISAGHALHVRGASSSPIPPYLDEYDENVRVVNEVYALLQTAGVPVSKFIDTTSTTQNENLNRIVNWHNAQSRDLDVSIHFNASSQTSQLQGDEVLYVSNTGLSVATPTAAAIASTAGWPNRGAKLRTDLFFLNNTNKPAVLVETCFVTSSGDGNRYRERFTDICKAIASSVADVSLQPVPPEPTPEPEVPSVDIVVKGNVKITINGEEFHPTPPAPEIPSYQTGIIATEFYGTGANGAYGIPIPGKGSSAKYLALPWKDQALKNRQVRVYNRTTGKVDVGEIWDLGPWFIDDNYPSLQERPLAETCYLNHQPCPRGPNAGKIPNGAGIDLSPALAASIGINGKGKVDWEFVDGGMV